MTEIGRSPEWPRVREAFLRLHPTCAACGTRNRLQVHHRQPYHLFPDLELVETNMITLCERPGVDHHLCFGHLGDFESWNIYVAEDAAAYLARLKSRPYEEKETVNDHGQCDPTPAY